MALLDILLQVFLADLSAIDHALRIGGNTFRAAGGGAFRIGERVGDERGDDAGPGAADADAALPAGVVTVTVALARFGIGDIKDVALADVEAAGAAELSPLIEKFAVLVEDLDAVVGAVPDEEAAGGIESQAVGSIELAGGRALLAPGLDERAVFGKLHHAGVGVAAVSVGDEDLAVGSDGHGGRLVERIGAIARDALLAEGEQDFAVGIELDDLVAAAVGDP